MTRAAALAAASVAFLGCASAKGPSPAESYAHALDENRLDAAYALTTPAFQAQVSAEEFQLRFADPAVRRARAAAVRDGLGGLARAAPELFGTDATEVPEAVILRFTAAVRAGHFDEAWRCLSTSVRSRYNVEDLSRDFRDEPTAAARLRRADLAAEGIPVVEGQTVRFPLAGGGAVVVLHESDGWKLQALE